MGETIETRALPAEIDVNDEIRLRLLEPADSQRIFEIVQSAPEIRDYLTWLAKLNSPNEIRQAIEGFRQNGEARYAIAEGDEVVGYVGLSRSRFEQYGNEYDMGYFCAPEKRRNGYVSSSVNSMMLAAKRHLAANSFALYIEDRNEPSQTVANKLGFHRTEQMAEDKILNCVERRYEKPAAEIE